MLDWLKRQTSKIKDNQSDYKFFVKHQPEVIDSSSTLTLTAYASQQQSATIPCIYKWSRIRNGLTTAVPQFKGSSFICEPSDVGSVIQAEITSTDRQHTGTAVIQYGPVKLDLMLKKQMETALASGHTSLNLYLVSRNEEKECQIRIFEDTIKICPVHSQLYYSFDYCLSEPRIQVVSKDPTRLYIIFNEKYEKEAKQFWNTLFGSSFNHSEEMTSSVTSSQRLMNVGEMRYQLKFTHRKQRDTFLFITKAFFTKREMKSSAIINKIQKIDFNNDQTFDKVLEIESIRMDLIRMYEINRQINKDKVLYQEQVRRLEKEIQDIIVTYTRIVEDKCKNQADLNQSYSILTNKRDQVMGKKYRNLEGENRSLNDRLRTMTEEVDRIRFNKSVMKNSQVAQEQLGIYDPPKQFSLKPELKFGQAAFRKKPFEDNFNNILDQLNQSEIPRENPESEVKFIKRINSLTEEKQSLEKKLEKSFHQIDSLEKKIHQHDRSATLQHSISHHQNPQNVTAINFTYGNNLQTGGTSFDDRHNVSAINLDYDKVVVDNKQLRKLNGSLQVENRNLQSDLSEFSEEGKAMKKLELQSDILRMEIEKKGHDTLNGSFLKKQVQTLRKEKRKMQDCIKSLQRENSHLKQQVSDLGKDRSVLESKYKRKLNDMNDELQILRKSQDALNRSQHLSIEMDSYNEEQLNILKEHNSVLSSENQKLSRAVEKYMGDAKQSNKLRQEIIGLKEQLSRKLINPEKSESMD